MLANLARAQGRAAARQTCRGGLARDVPARRERGIGTVKREQHISLRWRPTEAGDHGFGQSQVDGEGQGR